VPHPSQSDFQSDIAHKNLHPDDSQLHGSQRRPAHVAAEISGLLLIAFLLLALAAIRYGQAIHWSVR
jgi:hypothetical protein